MKLAFVVHTAYPEFIGGREHHVHHLAGELSKTEDVTVFAGSKCKLIQRQKLNGYTLVSFPMLSIRLSKNPLQIYRIIPKLYSFLKKEKFDLIHAFEYGSYSTDIAHLFSKKQDIPFFLTVYGYQLRNPLLKICKKIYDLFLGKSLLKDAKKIIYSSQVQRQEILKIIREKEMDGKLVLQVNSIPTQHYKDANIKEHLLTMYDLKDKIKLLTVARILPRKGIKNLVLALDKVVRHRSFKDIKLLIVGPDYGEMKNIKDKIKELRLEKNVIFVGAIHYDQIKELLWICDIFVLFSLYEALPLALLEAMACGKAVIFTDLPCAKKVITNGKDGILVKPTDVNALSEAILRLSNDKGLREYLGRNARNKIREFDSEIEAQRIRKIYLQVKDPKMPRNSA